jgi:hypothetical protein
MPSGSSVRGKAAAGEATYKGWRVIMLIAGLEIRVLSLDGTQLRRLTLNPAKDYQPLSTT